MPKPKSKSSKSKPAAKPAKKPSAKPAPQVYTTAEIAYFLWEAEGYPHGRDVEHWLKAEASKA